MVAYGGEVKKRDQSRKYERGFVWEGPLARLGVRQR